jgi:hypothetical protein
VCASVRKRRKWFSCWVVLCFEGLRSEQLKRKRKKCTLHVNWLILQQVGKSYCNKAKLYTAHVINERQFDIILITRLKRNFSSSLLLPTCRISILFPLFNNRYYNLYESCNVNYRAYKHTCELMKIPDIYISLIHGGLINWLNFYLFRLFIPLCANDVLLFLPPMHIYRVSISNC